jgi:hypothetical protein
MCEHGGEYVRCCAAYLGDQVCDSGKDRGAALDNLRFEAVDFILVSCQIKS